MRSEMTNEKKRHLKKNVGPAMQWAKRGRQDRSHAKNRAQIRVDFDLSNGSHAASEIRGGSQQPPPETQSTAGRGENNLSSDEQPGMSFGDRKSTRLNSSHVSISYAVFCLKKKKEQERPANDRQKKTNAQHTSHNN